MRKFLMTCFLAAVAGGVGAQSPITFYTMNFEPYGYRDNDGNVVGASVDIFKLLVAKLGMKEPLKVTILPPKRMASTLGQGENNLMFPLTYREERGAFADWVYRVNDATFQFAALKENGFEDERFKSLKLKDFTDGRVGVVRGSVFEKVMVQSGLDDSLISRANSSEQNLMKLANKRVKYLYTSSSILLPIFKHGEVNVDPESIHLSDVIRRAKVYIVSSKTFDQNRLKQINSALDKLEEEGHMDKIREKYNFTKPTEFH